VISAAEFAFLSCNLRAASYTTFILMTILTLTTGSAVHHVAGRTDHRARRRHGMSLLIFAGIVVGLPRGVADLYDKIKTNAWGAFTPVAIVMLLAVMVVVVAFIVFVERS